MIPRRFLSILLVSWLGLLPASGSASTPTTTDLNEVALTAKRDLDRALSGLAELRKQIEAARVPLARQVHDLEDQVVARRAQLDRARRSADNELVELNVLKAGTQARSNDVAVAEGLLAAYREAFNTRLHVSEAPRYEAAVRAAETARGGSRADPAARLVRQLELLNVGLERLERILGGEVFEGQALNGQGKLESGRFVLLGPSAWFAGEENGAAGLAQLRLNSPAPEVVAVPEDTIEGIRRVARQGKGILPLDATLGNAVKMQATQDSLLAHIKKGGPVMVPILLLGLSTLLIFAYKWVQVGRVKVASPGDLEVILAALEEGDSSRAREHARGIAGPVGGMLETAIEHARDSKEYVEEVMYEKLLTIRPRLERLLPFLALAAAAAPLLGLLGTVTGMINTFNMITVFGTGDPKTLAGGISEALITTEFGLVVAIPSLLLHAVLSRKVKGLLGSMEQLTVAFINGLSVETKPELTHSIENHA